MTFFGGIFFIAVGGILLPSIPKGFNLWGVAGASMKKETAFGWLCIINGLVFSVDFVFSLIQYNGGIYNLRRRLFYF